MTNGAGRNRPLTAFDSVTSVPGTAVSLDVSGSESASEFCANTLDPANKLRNASKAAACLVSSPEFFGVEVMVLLLSIREMPIIVN